jgi:hypothetical protein
MATRSSTAGLADRAGYRKVHAQGDNYCRVTAMVTIDDATIIQDDTEERLWRGIINAAIRSNQSSA